MLKRLALLFPAMVLFLMGAGCTQSPSPVTGYKLETRVIAVHENGSETPTGLVAISEGWPTFIVSPHLVASEDRQQVAYAVWSEEYHGVAIYVDTLNDGQRRLVARQSVPEGQGSLNVFSLGWVDHETIRYSESSIHEDLRWEVNIRTGEKNRVVVVDP